MYTTQPDVHIGHIRVAADHFISLLGSPFHNTWVIYPYRPSRQPAANQQPTLQNGLTNSLSPKGARVFLHSNS